MALWLIIVVLVLGALLAILSPRCFAPKRGGQRRGVVMEQNRGERGH